MALWLYYRVCRLYEQLRAWIMDFRDVCKYYGSLCILLGILLGVSELDGTAWDCCNHHIQIQDAQRFWLNKMGPINRVGSPWMWS
jgi:hypothetical protein